MTMVAFVFSKNQPLGQQVGLKGENFENVIFSGARKVVLHQFYVSINFIIVTRDSKQPKKVLKIILGRQIFRSKFAPMHLVQGEILISSISHCCSGVLTFFISSKVVLSKKLSFEAKKSLGGGCANTGNGEKPEILTLFGEKP